MRKQRKQNGIADGKTFTPAYIRVKKALIDVIIHTYGVEEYLPAQEELAGQYGVSRNTIRKTLELLNAEGYIETAKGKRSRILRRTVKAYQLIPLPERIQENIGILVVNDRKDNTMPSFRWTLVERLEEKFLKRGIQLIVYNLRIDSWTPPLSPKEILKSLQDNKIRFVFAASLGIVYPAGELFRLCRDSGIKVGFAGGETDVAVYPEAGFPDYIFPDWARTIHSALSEYFTDCSRFIFVTNRDSLHFSIERAVCVKEYARKHKIEFKLILADGEGVADEKRENLIAPETADAVLAAADGPRRILCIGANDHQTARISELIRAKSASRWKKFVFLGFDGKDFPGAECFSTFKTDWDSVAERALELFLHFAENPKRSLTSSHVFFSSVVFLNRRTDFPSFKKSTALNSSK